jgi:hypothetical protein
LLTSTSNIDEISQTLEICSLDEPPKRWTDDVDELCTVTWNKEISLESLPTKINRLGKVYYVLEFEIEMAFDGATLEFTVYNNDERVAGKNVKVEFH